MLSIKLLGASHELLLIPLPLTLRDLLLRLEKLEGVIPHILIDLIRIFFSVD